MATTEKVKINGQILEFRLTFGNQKKIIIRFREGQILASAPTYCSLKTVKQFVGQNFERLIQCQINYQNYQKISLNSPPWILIFNQKFAIEFFSTPRKTQFFGNKILLYNSGSEEILIKEIYRFLKSEYKNWFWERNYYWAKLMSVNFTSLSLRKMVSKWGVCYPKTQKITYNTKLIHYDSRIIDYVIVHELSHLSYPHHGIEFWKLVQKYIPNYQELKSELRS